MKKTLIVALSILSLNVLATGLVPEAVCTGTLVEEGSPAEKVTISVFVNPNKWCSTADERAVVSISSGLIGGQELVLATSKETDESTVISASEDGVEMLRLEYKIENVPSKGKALLIMDSVETALSCSFIEYHMDC